MNLCTFASKLTCPLFQVEKIVEIPVDRVIEKIVEVRTRPRGN